MQTETRIGRGRCRRRNPDPTPIDPETARVIDRIVRTHGAYLQRVLFLRGVRPCDVADELQRVWEILVRKVSRLPERPRTWLVSVAINRSWNHCQQRRRRESRLVAGVEKDCGDGRPDAEQALIGAEISHLVDGLEPELREVLLGCIAGETISEISESLHIPEGTVASRLRRARARIKTALSRHSS